MTNFNLRELIRAELDSTDEPVTTHDVASAVAEGIPANRRKAALVEALTYMVRERIVTARPKYTDKAASPAPRGRSWKREGIRSAHKSELDARYATEDGYKRLGSFNYDELLASAERCQSLAEANTAQAVRFRSLAAAVRDAGVGTVDDLDAGTLDTLGVAA